MSINQAFNQSRAYYDDWIKKALPGYEDIFKAATGIIPFEKTEAIRVLDLGAGTGLFSLHVFRQYPNAEFILYDLADKLLVLAKDRFAKHEGQFEFVVGDYRHLNGKDKFDLVISSLSIHHLPHDDKKKLFDTVFRLLSSRGAFINVDQIRGETMFLEDLYWHHWLDRVREVEPSEARIQESIHRRKTYDMDATLAEQLRWLSDAGFTNVDCVYKNFFVGVFLAMKAP